ncbi:SPIR1 protein, partial [Heliornis fulica]|nr:SPIR1 protein [Heliornis fulica]
QLLEHLGMLIYEALDWGIDSQVERKLSDPLEKMLSHMLQLDDEAMRTAITLQDVIKTCKKRLSRPSEATKHYEMICRSLFNEYMELQKLMTIIRTSKEVHLGSLFSCYSFYLHALTVDLAFTGFSKASLWHNIISELKHGVRLRKATERPQRHRPQTERTRSPYEVLLDDIQCKRYTLRKVSDQSAGSSESTLPHFSAVFPLALPCAILCLQVLEGCVPQDSNWHEGPMAEVKQPQKLWSPAARENGSRPKGT